jgi:hypothetical protein
MTWPDSRDFDVLNKIRTLLNRNGEPINGHPVSPVETDVTVPDEFDWSLEVRQGSDLLGSMHGQNPMSLITHFREYSVLYGNPASEYTVWLTHNTSDKRAPLTYQGSAAAWMSFLRQLDPEIDGASEGVHEPVSRTTMTDPHGQPMNVDSVFEAVFGQAD